MLPSHDDPERVSGPLGFVYTYKSRPRVTRVIMLGEHGVGKSSLMRRLLDDDLNRNPGPTVGIEYVNKVFEMKNGGKLMTQIWDTAATENFRNICMFHYRNAIGAIIIYDLTKPVTFAKCEEWLRDFREVAHEKAKVILVGNKLDRVEQDPSFRRVDAELVRRWASEHDVLHFEVSAAKNKHVYEAVEALLEGKLLLSRDLLDCEQLQSE